MFQMRVVMAGCLALDQKVTDPILADDFKIHEDRSLSILADDVVLAYFGPNTWHHITVQPERGLSL